MVHIDKHGDAVFTQKEKDGTVYNETDREENYLDEEIKQIAYKLAVFLVTHLPLTLHEGHSLFCLQHLIEAKSESSDYIDQHCIQVQHYRVEVVLVNILSAFLVVVLHPYLCGFFVPHCCLVVGPISPNVKYVHACDQTEQDYAIALSTLFDQQVSDGFFEPTVYVQDGQRNTQEQSLHDLVQAMCPQIHPGDGDCYHEEGSEYGIPELLLLVQKLKNENSHDSSKLCVSTGISVVLRTVISDISDAMVSPIGSWRAVEGLADGEEICIEECEDDSNESSHFLLGEEDVETGDGDDEHGVNQHGEEDEEIVEHGERVLLHTHDQCHPHVVQCL